MMKRLSNCGGFIFIETLLIAMLLSMAALLVMRGFQSAHKINHDMAVKTAGLHLANGRLAEIRQAIAKGETPSMEPTTETFDNLLGKEYDGGMTVQFEIVSTVSGNHYTVTVTPTVNDIPRTDLEVTAERDIFEDGY